MKITIDFEPGKLTVEEATAIATLISSAHKEKTLEIRKPDRHEKLLDECATDPYNG